MLRAYHELITGPLRPFDSQDRAVWRFRCDRGPRILRVNSLLVENRREVACIRVFARHQLERVSLSPLSCELAGHLHAR